MRDIVNGNFIYYIKDTTTEKFYVGSTGTNIEKRLDQHYYQLEKRTHPNPRFQELWDSGVSLISYAFGCKSLEEARAKELEVITANKNNPMMLNISLGVFGGDNLTNNPNREAIIAKIKKGVIKRNSLLTKEETMRMHSQPGEKNGMYGKTHTPEARKIISEAMKKRIPRRGFKLSSEQKKILSEHAKKRIGDKNPFFGKKHSAENIAKMVAKSNETKYAEGYIPPNAIGVLIDGVVYETIKQARLALNIKASLMSHRLKSKLPKYANYQYIDKCPTTIETTLVKAKGRE